MNAAEGGVIVNAAEGRVIVNAAEGGIVNAAGGRGRPIVKAAECRLLPARRSGG